MAQTKETARKSDKKGELPSQSGSSQTLATFVNRRSPRFLESDSEYKRAANMFGINTRRSLTHGVNQWGQLTHNQEDMEDDQVGLGLYSMEQGEHLEVPLG